MLISCEIKVANDIFVTNNNNWRNTFVTKVLNDPTTRNLFLDINLKMNFSLYKLYINLLLAKAAHTFFLIEKQSERQVFSKLNLS